MDDLKMIMYAKLCILMHSLLNVYENAMVIIFIFIQFFPKCKIDYCTFAADSGWKITIFDKRTLGFIFWRRRNIR